MYENYENRVKNFITEVKITIYNKLISIDDTSRTYNKSKRLNK